MTKLRNIQTQTIQEDNPEDLSITIADRMEDIEKSYPEAEYIDLKYQMCGGNGIQYSALLIYSIPVRYIPQAEDS